MTQVNPIHYSMDSEIRSTPVADLSSTEKYKAALAIAAHAHDAQDLEFLLDVFGIKMEDIKDEQGQRKKSREAS